MKKILLPGFTLALLVCGPLRAQDARFGAALNLTLPTGAFAGTTYPPDQFVASSTRESYDTGLGAQFTIAFPMDRKTALRLDLSGSANRGRATAAGYERLNLQQQMFSLGAEFQLFPGDGNAYRQSGTYFLAGVSADFERFDSSYGDPDYDPNNTYNRTRLGGVVGVGHTFRPNSGIRYSLEVAFHKTLSGSDTAAGDPPASDFVRVGFGFVF